MTVRTLKTPTAVIVDECESTCQTAWQALTELGYQIARATTVDDFFAASRTSVSCTDIFVDDASLFLIAVETDNCPGSQLIDWLQNCERWKGIPVIVMTPDGTTLPLYHPATNRTSISKPLDNQQLKAEIKKLSGIDEPDIISSSTCVTLTLSDILAREICRAQRDNSALSVLLASIVIPGNPHIPGHWIDQSKDTIRRAIRESDMVVSFGDDLILVILPMTDPEGAAVCETRIYDALLPLRRDWRYQTHRKVSFITATASFPTDAQQWKPLLTCAQERLLRNRPIQPAQALPRAA